MAYFIRADEPAGKGIQRVLREQNARILSPLANWSAEPADAIHRARQGCKRARAVAQLLKPAAPYIAAVENGFFRDIQQAIAYARDAEALVEALDHLKVGVTEPRLAESVAMLRESMVTRAVQNLESSHSLLAARIERACAGLREADRRLAQLPLADLRRRDLRTGAERTWHRCATVFVSLEPDSPVSDYHDWRRQVKYAAFQSQLMAHLAPARATMAAPRLRELAALLGDSQDLVLLEALLLEQPDALGIDTHVQRLRHLITAWLDELHRRALDVGRDVFGGTGNAVSDPGARSVT